MHRNFVVIPPKDDKLFLSRYQNKNRTDKALLDTTDSTIEEIKDTIEHFRKYGYNDDSDENEVA